MNETEIILGLLVAVAAVAWIANRLRVPYPILLVIGGLAMALVPHLPTVSLRPDHVFLLFLPPLLYYAGLHTSWRDFKANMRPIGLLAVGLVLFTTVLVAIAAHFIIGMNWAPAFVLGAIVSPPDAVAATSILQRLRVPRRIVTILEGESLVNDATALVTYQFAVAAVVTGSFSLTWAVPKFLIVSIGGVIVGLVAGMLVAWVRPRLRDSSVEHIVSLLTPYVAYLPAEWLHVSGVLAVVTCGIYIARRLGRITTAEVRLRSWAVWDAFNFLLEGLVFILIGLQISQILKNIPTGTSAEVIGWPLAIAIVAIVARLLWVPAATYLPRMLSRKLAERDPVPPRRNIFLVAWTQMRGVVSLAAALALPMTTADGQPFPYRNLIAFLTFGVILVTLVGQGLTLPAIIRWLGMDRGRDEQSGEENTARYLAALAAIERLDTLGANDAAAASALQRARAEYDERIAFYSRTITPDDGPGAGAILACETGEDVIKQAIQAQRDMLGRLRDQGVIGDDVLRHLEHELDHEEARMLD